MKKIAVVLVSVFGLLAISPFVLKNGNIYAQDWKTIADNIIMDYKGKIISIEQLNSTTCWAVLSPRLSNYQAMEVAENIGYYIKNVIGKTPVVHVFVNGRHIAIARPSGKKYIGKVKIQDWNPSVFGGQHRP